MTQGMRGRRRRPLRTPRARALFSQHTARGWGGVRGQWGLWQFSFEAEKAFSPVKSVLRCNLTS